MAAPKSFKQELVGVFGFPVAENPTQAMIEPAFAELGLDWRYLTVEVRPDQLADAVRGARAMNWRGFNCTIPHKVAVIEYLDRLSPTAEIIGAVNCVVASDGELIGENTDGKGFLESITTLGPVTGRQVVILGAGGAARAIATELALAGAAKITIVNRHPERGASLAAMIDDRTGVVAIPVKWEGEYQIPPETDIVINATSIGLYPDVDARVPIDLGTLLPRMIVCDVIPNPPRTRLITDAQARGCIVLDGLGMLVNQGIIGIRHWTGQTASATTMRRALETLF